MRVSDVKSGFFGMASATIASLCCLLPLAVIVLGLGSGAFMMTTMRYRAIFIPAGIIGVAIGWTFYLRERKRCNALSCRMSGGRLNLALLLLATVIVAGAVALDQLPNFTADLLMRATSGTSDTTPASVSTADHPVMGHEGDMK
ncbi:MAG: hypothetical protein C3F12_08350 [Candidatus Methylomirabilota bacterium]|nr:hypothetical protein [candidate division NC10 bacterium]PWB46064.1 MAG: hypothetical protein C3F12_08350 [candidate division NC10 bacterium]